MKTSNSCVTLFAACFVLSSCAFDQIESGFTALEGQKIQTAFEYLGYPDSEQEIAGSKVFTWGREFTRTSVTPVNSYNYGGIYGYDGYGSAVGYSTSYIPQTNYYSCTLKLITDQDGTIIDGQYDGDLGGCAKYGSALDEAAEDLAPEATP